MKIYRPAFIRGECPHSTAQQITYFDCILLKISYLLFEFLLSQVVEFDTRHGRGAQQITHFNCILLKINYLLFVFLLSQVVEWDTRHGCEI